MYFFYILGVLTATFLIPVDGACNDVAIAFLSAFYHGTGGPNWSDNTNWMDYTQNPCDTKDSEYYDISISLNIQFYLPFFIFFFFFCFFFIFFFFRLVQTDTCKRCHHWKVGCQHH